MQLLEKIFSNTWVIGIVGGIISGIIVYFITKWLFERKDNSKYLEQIKNANADIIRLLKPYIAERGLPEKEIIDAIILSTARKHSVKVEELYSIRIVCEEIIREIIENVYVSSDKKHEYTNNLREYLHQLNIEKDKSVLISDIEKDINNNILISKLKYKQKYLSALSVTLSTFTAILSLVLSILYDNSQLIESPTRETESFLIITFVTVLTLCFSMLLLLYQKIRDNLKDKRNKQ